MKNTYQKRACALLLLLGIILIMAIAAICGRSRRTKIKEYRIYQNGSLVMTLSPTLPNGNTALLSQADILESTESHLRFTLQSENGGTNEITIDYTDSFLCVTGSSCPDHLCEKMGGTGSDLPIVCLPNKLVIVSVTDSSEDDIDASTY